MNYLAHALLSGENELVLLGNLAGDYFKGSNVLSELPEDLATGIRLHRFIDQYTDQHYAVSRAKILFREHFGLYAGAVVDVCMDHFLANDPLYFSGYNDLKAYTQQLYKKLEKHDSLFPEKFLPIYQSMVKHDWMSAYYQLPKMRNAFKGLESRSKNLIDGDKAFEGLVTNFYTLNQCYIELYDDLAKAVKVELKALLRR